jgi:leucine dehydrogenase/phenylalanine dehydrogenase
MDEWGHEQVIFCRHPETGLKAIIAIHDTTLGPALGGCRMYPYASSSEALEDVLRLSQSMTYKCAAADVDFGGGKMVIIGDPRTDKSPEMFRVLGRFVSSLHGRFYTGTDLGTTPEDFIHAARESGQIVGLPESCGGAGDTSIPTAMGVLQGIRAAVKYLWDRDQLSGMTVAVQGIGKVGKRLVELLVQEDAKVWITDLDMERCWQAKMQFPEKVEIVSPEEIYSIDCDIFSPCARGGILNNQTIPLLRCQAVVGSANNQLADQQSGEQLDQRGILYAPDYVVNAGGLILVANEIEKGNKQTAIEKTKAIYEILLEIFERSRQERIPTFQAADRIVAQRLRQASDRLRIWIGKDRR